MTIDEKKIGKACMWGNADPCTQLGEIRYYICDEHLKEKILVPLIKKIEEAEYRL